MVRKRKIRILCTALRDFKRYGNLSDSSSKKIKNRATLGSSNSILGSITELKETRSEDVER